jgi:hypothetical protein
MWAGVRSYYDELTLHSNKTLVRARGCKAGRPLMFARPPRTGSSLISHRTWGVSLFARSPVGIVCCAMTEVLVVGSANIDEVFGLPQCASCLCECELALTEAAQYRATGRDHREHVVHSDRRRQGLEPSDSSSQGGLLVSL